MTAHRSPDPTIPNAWWIQGERLHSSLPISLVARLEDYATKAGLTKAAIVKASLDNWLKERGA